MRVSLIVRARAHMFHEAYVEIRRVRASASATRINLINKPTHRILHLTGGSYSHEFKPRHERDVHVLTKKDVPATRHEQRA
jgi:hypothetical protein